MVNRRKPAAKKKTVFDFPHIPCPPNYLPNDTISRIRFINTTSFFVSSWDGTVRGFQIQTSPTPSLMPVCLMTCGSPVLDILPIPNTTEIVCACLSGEVMVWSYANVQQPQKMVMGKHAAPAFALGVIGSLGLILSCGYDNEVKTFTPQYQPGPTCKVPFSVTAFAAKDCVAANDNTQKPRPFYAVCGYITKVTSGIQQRMAVVDLSPSSLPLDSSKRAKQVTLDATVLDDQSYPTGLEFGPKGQLFYVGYTNSRIVVARNPGINSPVFGAASVKSKHSYRFVAYKPDLKATDLKDMATVISGGQVPQHINLKYTDYNSVTGIVPVNDALRPGSKKKRRFLLTGSSVSLSATRPLNQPNSMSYHICCWDTLNTEGCGTMAVYPHQMGLAPQQCMVVSVDGAACNVDDILGVTAMSSNDTCDMLVVALGYNTTESSQAAQGQKCGFAVYHVSPELLD
ncbi:hypothetical protein KIPB_004810 [Kipferlia bialata]|uniref:Uncharacterized protein n=1 Tax=Kipferlia bialata TaxID=797122 RepID=A0A9K3CW30_9EUKA|nr:hypothetical protein KIPB_004810 [Kipferlia bialata]|eukprot:g4810.t1